MAHMINELLSGFLYFNVEAIAVMVIINVDIMFPSDSVLELPHIGWLEPVVNFYQPTSTIHVFILLCVNF